MPQRDDIELLALQLLQIACNVDAGYLSCFLPGGCRRFKSGNLPSLTLTGKEQFSRSTSIVENGNVFLELFDELDFPSHGEFSSKEVKKTKDSYRFSSVGYVMIGLVVPG